MMLNHDQHQLLQEFVSMPDPTYAEIFGLQHEVEDLTAQLETKTEQVEVLEDDLKDAEQDKDDKDARIRELEAALADALSRIAGDVIPSDLAETDKEFHRLYKVL